MKDSAFVAFADGFKYYSEVDSSRVASVVDWSTNGEYLMRLQDSIDALAFDMNSYVGDNRPQFHGFVFESFHKGTFNIDALAKRTGEKSNIPSANPFASSDISTTWGEQFQAKDYRTGAASGLAQSVSFYQKYSIYQSKHPDATWNLWCEERGIDPNVDWNLPIYEAQARLIPSDQIQDAIRALEKAAKHASDAAKQRYNDTLSKLVDHVKSPRGAESLRLTRDESISLSECCKDGNFDPQKFNLTLAKKADSLFLLKNAATSGLSALAVSAVLNAAPYIAEALLQLVKDGKVDEGQLEKVGTSLGTGGVEGFIRGFVLATVLDTCRLGYFGSCLQELALNSSPLFVPMAAQLVNTIIGSVSDSIRMMRGKINCREFVLLTEKRLFITGCSIGVGLVFQSIPVPILGYTIGSFIGSVFGGLVFQLKESVMVALCVNNGWTFFGVVEQDYSIPYPMKKYLELDSYEYETYEYETYECEKYPYESYSFAAYDFEKFGMVYLERGIIGIRKIGYKAIVR